MDPEAQERATAARRLDQIQYGSVHGGYAGPPPAPDEPTGWAGVASLVWGNVPPPSSVLWDGTTWPPPQELTLSEILTNLHWRIFALETLVKDHERTIDRLNART